MLREKIGISQSALGEAIGLSYQQIQKYENGATPITVERLQQIGMVLGVEVSDILSSRFADKVMEKTQVYEQRRIKLKGFWDDVSKEELLLLRKFRSITDKRLRRSILLQVKILSNVGKREF